jgi:hypothetical protein
MQYMQEVSIEDADHRLYLAKDRSKRSTKPGKFSARAKADKPKNRILERLDRECKKESIRDIELCKRRISQARFSRRKAEGEGRQTRRMEVRYYSCQRHSVPQWHLTKLGEAEYAMKVADFARVGGSFAA